MNREVKFRAWDKKRKVMLYPPLEIDSMIAVRQGSPDGPHLDIGDCSFPAIMTWTGLCYIDGVLQDLEFLQFTGLCDRRGVEIWEGDILKEVHPRGNIYQVFRVPGGFAINVFQDERDKIRTFCEALADDQTSSYVQTQCEVVGNVWENPEMMREDI